MSNPLKRVGLPCLLAAILAMPAAAGHYPCGCGSFAPMPRAEVYDRYQAHDYGMRVEPSLPAEYSAPRNRDQHITSEYYTPDESNVLYHPVVVPLDEFLRPGEPAALSRDQLDRQRRAAEARTTPRQPPQVATPPITRPEADPFADDAAAAGASTAPAVPSEQPAPEVTQPMPIPPQVTPPQPAAEPAEQDPFETLEATE